MEDSAKTPHLAHWTKCPLNLDVLGTICSYLTQYPDFLSLSLACSTFRPLAVRTMLRTRPVVLKNITTIIKFSDFVFSDAAARMPHLVALVIVVAEGEINLDQESRERAIEALVIHALAKRYEGVVGARHHHAIFAALLDRFAQQ